jgi:hypothetical protein
MNTPRIKNYEGIYDQLAVLYEKTLSIPKACTELNISKSYYYKICEKLHKPSVASKNVALVALPRQTGGGNMTDPNNIEAYIINEQSENSNAGKTSLTDAEIERRFKPIEDRYRRRGLEDENAENNRSNGSPKPGSP